MTNEKPVMFFHSDIIPFCKIGMHFFLIAKWKNCTESD